VVEERKERCRVESVLLMYILKQISVLLVLVGVSYPVNTETIRPDGMGPIRIGMSLAELNTVLHENFS
jgi:hypothetical protein